LGPYATADQLGAIGIDLKKRPDHFGAPASMLDGGTGIRDGSPVVNKPNDGIMV
jgi:hypothetical protein